MKPFVALLMLCAAALSMPLSLKAQPQQGLRLKTIVIDPGHGGKDPGCVSKDRKTYEKDIVLDIALRLQKKIEAAYPDVTAKMTRTDDRFVELEGRASFANKSNANLFLSIHVNSTGSGTTAKGYSVHVLGQSKKEGNDLYSKNLELVKRENSVIKLEDNYETTYQGFDPSDPQSSIIFSLMQNAYLGSSLQFAEDIAAAMGTSPIKHSRGVSQDPFWVLWRTAMPAVLIECGFITNPDDLSQLRSEKGREQIADNLLKAFGTFKERYDGSMQIEDKAPESSRETATPEAHPQDEASSGSETEAAPSEGPVYGVQVLASSRKMDGSDPFFQGYKPLVIKSGKLYKYIICTSASAKTVKKDFAKIQKKFPDSYVVKVQDGTVSPLK